ncbi:MAG: hypothetical protein KF887_12490 [Paracoccaceae bacterium]|nr:MAG: hypothetical protein KF887_12490 [Paracoccaceae bacterium]
MEDDADMAEDALGSIWLDGMVALIVRGVDSSASDRKLDLIGPERCDVVGYETTGSGVVWSVLSDRGEAMDLVRSNVDELIDPDGDLSELSDEMVDAFIAAATEDAEGVAVSKIFDSFEHQLRELLTECDVLPALRTIRAGLLEQLDG